jgi:hypothetical protein
VTFVLCPVLFFGVVRRHSIFIETQDITQICYSVKATLNLDAHKIITKHNKCVENINCQMLTALITGCVCCIWRDTDFASVWMDTEAMKLSTWRYYLFGLLTSPHIKKKFGDWIDARSQAIGCAGMASTHSEQTGWVVLPLICASSTVYLSTGTNHCGRFRIPDDGSKPRKIKILQICMFL